MIVRVSFRTHEEVNNYIKEKGIKKEDIFSECVYCEPKYRTFSIPEYSFKKIYELFYWVDDETTI